jgi:hypothetical protein
MIFNRLSRMQQLYAGIFPDGRVFICCCAHKTLILFMYICSSDRSSVVQKTRPQKISTYDRATQAARLRAN